MMMTGKIPPLVFAYVSEGGMTKRQHWQLTTFFSKSWNPPPQLHKNVINTQLQKPSQAFN
jgi:hypothetical protein